MSLNAQFFDMVPPNTLYPSTSHRAKIFSFALSLFYCVFILIPSITTYQISKSYMVLISCSENLYGIHKNKKERLSVLHKLFFLNFYTQYLGIKLPLIKISLYHFSISKIFIFNSLLRKMFLDN